ncbi:MipA/OmpV family protein [Mangrovicella endophytica]|uniref:MipA/OmpV family protein n=1 Tax=Mangrovicella endophytica TaxID=2066697 RepID=UPI000C9E8CB7|nr:MipA/OmpV family protein [Mangrovicella endophytica]
MSLSLSKITCRYIVGFGSLLGAAVPAAKQVHAADAAIAETVPETVYAAPEPSRFGRISQRLHEWEVIVGAGAKIDPKYEGSDEFEVTPVPYISATFGDWLSIDPRGVTAEVYETGPFSFSAQLGYETGRSEDDADELDGLGDVDFGVTVGGKAAAKFGPAEVFGSVEKTVGGSDGLLAVAGVELTHAVTPSLLLGAKASATFADDKHMQAYFGIDEGQSERSGYQRFEAEAGIKRVDFAATATVGVTENWFARGEAGVGLLLGDAADSPVVKEEVQPFGMAVVGYRF